MPFGEIFTGAFQRIWHHKKLWLLAMLGLALGGIGMLIYSLLAGQWMGGYFSFINRMMRNPYTLPGTALSDMMGSMTTLWVGGALAGLLGLVGYIVNLVMRGAIISEANRAWQGQPTDTRRGLQRGLSRAIYVFLIDLAWWVPGILLAGVGIVLFVLLIAGSAAASETNRAGGLIASSWIAFLCCGGCAGLLYYLAFAILSPLMYQSAVAGERSTGAALSEGWSLAKAHLGAMIIFWLLLVLVGIVFGVIQQAVGTVASVPMLSGWFRMMADTMQGLNRGALPVIPTISGPLLAFAGVISTLLWFLISTFTQTLNLTLYAGVYQRLVGGPRLAPVTPEAPVVPPAPLTPVSPDAPVVPPEPPSEDEAPPAL